MKCSISEKCHRLPETVILLYHLIITKSIRFVGATLWNMLSNELRETMDFNTLNDLL